MNTYQMSFWWIWIFFVRILKLWRTCWITFWGKTRWIKQLLLGSPGFVRVFSTQIVRVTTGNGCFTNHLLLKKGALYLTDTSPEIEQIYKYIGWCWDMIPGWFNRWKNATSSAFVFLNRTEAKRQKTEAPSEKFRSKVVKVSSIGSWPELWEFFSTEKSENADSSVSMVLFFLCSKDSESAENNT